MITVKFNGVEIQVETLQDAAELTRLMTAREKVAAPSHQPAAGDLRSNNTPQQLGFGKFHQFVEQISKHAGKSVSSEKFGEIIGVDGTRGIGPKLSSIQRDAGDVDVAEIVKREHDEQGNRVWKIAPQSAIETAIKK